MLTSKECFAIFDPFSYVPVYVLCGLWKASSASSPTENYASIRVRGRTLSANLRISPANYPAVMKTARFDTQLANSS